MRASTTSTIAWRLPGLCRPETLKESHFARGDYRHGSTQIIRQEKVRQSSEQARRVSHAPQEEGNAAKRKRKESHQPQAGDRNRSFRSAGERRQGSAKTLVGEKVVGWQRSEEHTSELQSPCNLVCRLLLEK